MADENDLPEELKQMVINGFQQEGTPLRKNKDGKYPTLLAITRFINYLYAGTNKGTRRASKKLLEKMGFPACLQEQRADQGRYAERQASLK